MTEATVESAQFARLIAELRRLQHAVAQSRPPEDVASAAAETLAGVAALLEPYTVTESDRISGRLWDRPGRGQAFIPPITIDHSDSERRSGRVTFGPAQLGAGGVVHGGSIPLVFVEMLGLLLNVPGVPVRRLAYLHVNFRAPVMIDREVNIEARMVRSEGRKLFISGSIRGDGDQSELATADALFLLPKQV